MNFRGVLPQNNRLRERWATLRRTVLRRPYWGYEDVGVFCLTLVLVSTAIRFAIRLDLLPTNSTARPPVSLQLVVILLLGVSLPAILKIRHHQPVLLPLGFFWPALKHVVVAIGLGASLAAAVSVATPTAVPGQRSLPTFDFLILGVVLGPLLEESFFRGLLLPLISNRAGDIAAVTVCAVLFALFHGPTSPAHCVWLTATGIAYGYIRVLSRSTTAAFLMHATYNLLMLLSPFPVLGRGIL